jgi:hypothetical protein
VRYHRGVGTTCSGGRGAGSYGAACRDRVGGARSRGRRAKGGRKEEGKENKKEKEKKEKEKGKRRKEKRKRIRKFSKILRKLGERGKGFFVGFSSGSSTRGANVVSAVKQVGWRDHGRLGILGEVADRGAVAALGDMT